MDPKNEILIRAQSVIDKADKYRTKADSLLQNHLVFLAQIPEAGSDNYEKASIKVAYDHVKSKLT
jgi:hypothetical protein